MHGQTEEDNITLHSKKEKRWRCRKCNKTFAATRGTIFYRRKYDHRFMSQMVSLMAYGCPPVAIEKTYHLDERTVAAWHRAAGAHCQALHEHILWSYPMDLQQVQADEIRVKAQGRILWMALAICVTTRLWLGGVVSEHRDKYLVRALALQVRACALCRPLLVVFDGFAAYVKEFRKALRSPCHSGKRGRPPLLEWPGVVLAQIIKSRQGRRLRDITRRVVEGPRVVALGQPSPSENRAQAALLIKVSQGGGSLNTSYIERLNATFRSRLCALVRRTRSLVRDPIRLEHSMYLVGCVYNFCTFHESLSVPLILCDGYSERVRQVKRTPAQAASLTDHRWSVFGLLNYRLPPDLPLHG
jgi:transposase-like protein